MSHDFLSQFQGADDECESLGPDVRVGRKPPAMLQFAWPDGNRRAIAYAMLASVEFNASSGLTLEFARLRVTVRGRCLAAVFDALREHRVVSLGVADLTAVAATGDVPLIDSIQVATPPR